MLPLAAVPGLSPSVKAHSPARPHIPPTTRVAPHPPREFGDDRPSTHPPPKIGRLSDALQQHHDLPARCLQLSVNLLHVLFTLFV